MGFLLVYIILRLQSYTIYSIDTNDKTDDNIDNIDYMVIGNFLIRW